MGFLLVDERDGRVLAYLVDPVEAFRAVDELEQADPDLAGALCLVTFNERRNSLFGAETTTQVRSLT